MEIILLIILICLIILVVINIYVTIKSNKNNQSQEFANVNNSVNNIQNNLTRIENNFKDDFNQNRESLNNNIKDFRGEISNSLKNFNDSITNSITGMGNLQKGQLDTFSKQLGDLTKSNENKLESMKDTIENRLKSLQDDNAQKLEKMRETVDEKLQSTLEKRLGESFKQVSDRLEQVHKGLGEMQTLAIGVGDLKKVLSNVKAKGILGEYQLGNILDQILTIEQYGRNVKTKKGSNDNVEFAVKLPGRNDNDSIVWLPIDSKSPTEDFQVLVDAYERADIEVIEISKKQLVSKIKIFAKDIKEKYLDPPNTTDFGIMFLPYEGLYAEVLRIPGLFELLQREYKVVITGPTTLSALLNSLQMGFRTLAIEKRTSEIWTLLGAVKTEFGNFATVLEKTKDKLDKASSEIDKASIRSRSIERKLRDVQELPQTEAMNILGESVITEPENTDDNN